MEDEESLVKPSIITPAIASPSGPYSSWQSITRGRLHSNMGPAGTKVTANACAALFIEGSKREVSSLRDMDS